MKKIVIYGMRPEEEDAIRQELTGTYVLHFCRNTEEYLDVRTYEQASLVVSGNPNLPLGEDYFALLEQAGVHYAVYRMTGVGQIDFAAARAHHVRIANVQNYSPNAIAELAVALALALNRHLPLYGEMTRTGSFVHPADEPIFREIRDCTVGILGVGHIGSVTAKTFAAMGARVIGYDVHPWQPNEAFMTYTDLATVQKESDIICIHLPASKENYHLINAQFLRQLKPDCLLVNAARGDLVSLHDVCEAVRNQQIGGYGTDVLEHEPEIFNHPAEEIKDPEVQEACALYPRILITPHVGAWTARAHQAMIDITIAEARSFLEEDKAQYEISSGF